MVGIEDSFLAFENVQRRTAQPATFQRRKKSLGIDQCATRRVDDEGAVPHVFETSTIEEMVGVRSQWHMERHHIALPQQHVKRHRLDRGRATTVIGQDAAAEPPQPVQHCHADAPVPTTPTVMSRSSFPGWSFNR